jgi:energy-coupling factor transporter transmembrane protein EcfT
MVLPLFRKALIRCQEVAWALAARGYHDNVPLNLAPIPGSHLAALSLWLLAVALAVWISGRGTT